MIELERILCPVDFTDVTPYGLRPASALAIQYGAELSLLYVLNFPYPLVGPYSPNFELDHVYRDLEVEAAERMADLVDGLPDGPEVRTMVARGTPARTIVEQAAEQSADLLVMPTHGRVGLDHLLSGSVAEKVLRLAPCPVLTVSPREAEPRAFAPRKVLFATDFSPIGNSALEHAAAIASTYGAELLMVHVVTLHGADPGNPEWRFPGLPAKYLEAVMEHAGATLDGLVAAAAAEVKVDRRLVRGFDAALEIVRLARQEDVDVVVMATHGHSGFMHAILGSTATKVVRCCECPVLTIHDRDRVEGVLADQSVKRTGAAFNAAEATV